MNSREFRSESQARAQSLQKQLLSSLKNAKDKLERFRVADGKKHAQSCAKPEEAKHKLFATPTFSNIIGIPMAECRQETDKQNIAKEGLSKVVTQLQQRINVLDKQRRAMADEKQNLQNYYLAEIKSLRQTLQFSQGSFSEHQDKIKNLQFKLAESQLLRQSKEVGVQQAKRMNAALELKLREYEDRVSDYQSQILQLRSQLSEKGVDKLAVAKITGLQEQNLKLRNLLQKERIITNREVDSASHIGNKLSSQQQQIVALNTLVSELTYLNKKLQKKLKKTQKGLGVAESERLQLESKLGQFYSCFSQLRGRLEKMPTLMSNPIRSLLSKVAKIDSQLQRVRRERPTLGGSRSDSRDSRSQSKLKIKGKRARLLTIQRQRQQDHPSEYSDISRAKSKSAKKITMAVEDDSKQKLIGIEIAKLQRKINQARREGEKCHLQLERGNRQQREYYRQKLNQLTGELQNDIDALRRLKKHSKDFCF